MLGLWSIRKTVGAPGPVDGALEWPRPERCWLAGLGGLAVEDT